MIKQTLQHIIGYCKCRANKIITKGNCYIGINCKIVNGGSIEIGENVKIRPYTNIYAVKDASINLASNVEIGRDSTLSAYNQIVMRGGVLTGPHVFIADHNHEYKDINIPVYKQGIRANEGDRVEIGEGTWIGTNAVIVGNVKIGRNCVIGANSVVTRDIPDYCVAAGIPAKVIKKYDFSTCKWIKV